MGGPGLAGQALAAGLVDQCHLFLTPVLMGEAHVRAPTVST